jgi:ABC-type multidrug transport system fused ATPase/permease subunit
VKLRQAISASLALLSARDRRLYGVSVAIQMTTSLLDLAGVLLLGAVGALAVTTVQSQPPPPALQQVVDVFGLGSLTSQTLVLVLAGIAALLLLSKSVFSSLLLRRVLIFLANRQALVAAYLARGLLSQSLTFVQRRSTQETSFILIQGAGAATVQVLGQTSVLLTEAALLIALSVALLFLDPLATIAAVAFFSVLAFALQRAMGNWALRMGRTAATADIASLGAIQEAISAYREIATLDRRHHYIDRIQTHRWKAAKVAADMQFVGLFPKYMFEAALVIGAFALALVLFATRDSIAAVGTLALFLAAGSRVMPSLLRLQGAAIGLRSSTGVAETTYALAAELGNLPVPSGSTDTAVVIRERLKMGHPNFSPAIKLDRVCFTYPGAADPAVQDVSFSASPGQFIALAGRSGAGKSTIADIVLGLLAPLSGEALVGHVRASEAPSVWPGGIAYVPQDVILVEGTIRENVALGLPSEAIDDDRVWTVLRQTNLADFLRHEREGLDTVVGERGMRLSGGQRQRLGIARAMYSGPKLLVLDEATAALDAETESLLTATLNSLGSDVTRIVIAHRLSTITDADQVLYLQNGHLVGQGSFEQVCRDVPELAHQARLMGISR